MRGLKTDTREIVKMKLSKAKIQRLTDFSEGLIAGMVDFKCREIDDYWRSYKIGKTYYDINVWCNGIKLMATVYETLPDIDGDLSTYTSAWIQLIEIDEPTYMKEMESDSDEN